MKTETQAFSQKPLDALPEKKVEFKMPIENALLAQLRLRCSVFHCCEPRAIGLLNSVYEWLIRIREGNVLSDQVATSTVNYYY